MVSTKRRSVALALQGGGARGAYQTGVIKAIARIGNGRKNPFRIVSGASVGALNAAALASGATDFTRSAQRLETLWRRLTSSSIYETRRSVFLVAIGRQLARLLFSRQGLPAGFGLLDNAPFRSLLQREFSGDEVGQAIRAGALDALCVTASSYDTGRAVTFFEAREGIDDWHRARRDGLRTCINPDHLLASSALPLLFRSVAVDGHHCGDGALRLRTPLSPAIRMGATGILAIAVRDPEPDSGLAYSFNGVSPSPGAIGGHLLDILFNDSLDADIERLQRINETLALLSTDARKQTPLRPIDILVVRPSRDIRTLAEEHRRELPPGARLLLRSLGAAGGNGQLASYLLFEPGFINALIDLGQADTLARREEVDAFLFR